VADTVGVRRSSQLIVVPQAVDLARFRPGPTDREWRHRLTSDVNAPLIGIIGRVDPEKGVDVAVQATTMLGGAAARAHLVVVGAPGLDDGRYQRNVQRDALKRLGTRVRFIESSEDVPGILRALDVLVNASVAEPFGLTVLEAQASGIPVVATASGGIPEFVTDGENGLLVASGNPGAMAHALSRLLCESDLRARLARHARRTVEEHYGIDTRAEAIAQIYHQIVRHRPMHRQRA